VPRHRRLLRRHGNAGVLRDRPVLATAGARSDIRVAGGLGAASCLHFGNDIGISAATLWSIPASLMVIIIGFNDSRPAQLKV